MALFAIVSLISLCMSLVASVLLLRGHYLRITSIGWLVAIIWIPFLGSLFFFLLVVREKQQTLDASFCKMPQPESSSANYYGESSIARLNNIANQYAFDTYKDITDAKILRDDDFLPALIDVIDGAKSSIWLCTYILKGDVQAQLIQHLLDAEQRGVVIKLLVDRVGSGLFGMFNRKRRKLKSLPFACHIYHQYLKRSILFVEKRLHSKIVIVDGELAIIGSHNLRDEILSGNPKFVKNISLKITGSVVEQLSRVFASLWESNSGEKLECLRTDTPLKMTQNSSLPEGAYSKLGRIIYANPLTRDYQYAEYLNTLIFGVRKRLYIWMPYVIPPQVMRSNLIAATKNGMDVKVLIPKKSDSQLVDNAHELVLNELVNCGVACAVSEGVFDHSKIILIDDTVIIGSTNLDYRSLHRNHETNIEITHVEFASQIATMFEQTYNQAELIRCVNPQPLKTVVNQITSLIASLY